MPPELLTCTICPKKPKFSDISHLLTHVGSKGHLSHLHKLQVRSHQEEFAVIELEAYDAWYQAYDLGQLLSERMIQKNAKQAGKRFAPGSRNVVTKREDFIVDPLLGLPSVEPPPQVKPRQRNKAKNRTSRGQIKDDDSDFTPIRRSRRSKTEAVHPSPVKRSSSVDCSRCTEDDDDHFVPPRTPQNATLKGQVWPGMALFDAASDEMKRKRNQKKDGSVLTRMQTTSVMIEPMEVTFSPGGTLRRQRHIDSLDDVTSLIEGETPIVPLSARRRRQPLVPRSTNVPRLVKRKRRTVVSQKPRKAIAHGLPRPSDSSIMTSSSSYGPDLSPGYTPTEDENTEFKLTFGKMQKTKKTGNFTIFKDNDTEVANPLKHPMNPFLSARQPYTYAANVRHEPWASPAWLQPQLQPLYYQLHGAARASYSGLPGFDEASLDKENIEPGAPRTMASANSQNANPLFWRSGQFDGLAAVDPAHTYHDLSTNPFSLSHGLEDPFSGPRNPFATAFGSFGPDTTLGQLKQDSNYQLSSPSKGRLAANPLMTIAE